MIVLGCHKCLTVIRVVSGDESLLSESRWASGYPCVTHGCGGKMLGLKKDVYRSLGVAKKAGIVREFSLTSEEALRALLGAGLPSEIGCSPETVRAMLLSTDVVSVDVEEAGGGRALLTRLGLSNGVSLHLSISPKGPVVYKITRDERDSVHGVSEKQGE